MPDTVADPHALIMTPTGRDFDIAAALLRDIDIAARGVRDIADLVGHLGDNVLFALITEETLRTCDLRPLADWVRVQESWSDLTFILLTQRGGGPERNPAAARLSETLGNVTFIERPFHPTTFLSVAKTALKGRRRQYESRSILGELRESGERLRTALVAGRLGSWEFDVERREFTCSDACKAVFGREPDAPFTYRDLLASVHPDDLKHVKDSARNTIATGDDYAIEHRTIWPDGSLHWAELRARLVRSHGRVRMVGVSLDITTRKVAEEQLRVQNETLEARVAARTRELEEAYRATLDQIAQRELAESKLRQSQKMEMIGQLTGGIAHDFNNLLMAVIGNLDLLRKHLPDDPKTVRLIEGAQLGAKRGASLTQRLLAFARRQDLVLVVTDLGDLVRGMTELIERTIGSAIELRFDLPEEPVRSELDPNQVELALLNLVVNARDAMPEGGTLMIRVDPELAPATGNAAEGFVRLCVIDSGQGMDAATLEKATEPFFSTKGVGKGTGLGLSMIHGLVKQLGGEFKLTSAVGQGTTAELLFPATMKDAPSVAAPAMPAAPNTDRRRLRILLVDDDPLIAMSSVDMLEDLGHEVFEANSGEAALRHLGESGRIDLMITDFSMPRMNGAQLARAAKELDPDLPIILATGYAELPPGMEINVPRLGKPYDQDQLAAQIEALMPTMPAGTL
ncbi:hybrid sensor histidine kinase/response regulator [Aurantimonas sp. VKM B-3413]|uniref:hybrid sensor histidine kinase/response regulator n=1 Tax=Aurantimonas sp. VKM B-3413 TaxID=2779401 RepID=UPI001E3FF12C|nr:hybrid sensor histidine kinase/response regulator [Aurantimonas sp. VKM B-3413]MCB8837961.1 response regulator [Aurantimonas sp. VKM B-3413]